MQAIQTHGPKISKRAKRFAATVLAAGAFGLAAYATWKEMPLDSVEVTGTAASCKPREACEVLAKKGDTIWHVNIAGGEFEHGIGVAGVDERGVVFSRYVSGVRGKSSELFRVNYDGSAENLPSTLAGIKAQKSGESGIAKVTIE